MNMNFSKRGLLLGVIAAGTLALSPAAVAHGSGGGGGGHGGGHSGGGHSFSGHGSGSHHGGFNHGGGHHRHHGSFVFYPYYSAFYGSFYPGYGYWGYYPGYGYGYGGYGYGRYAYGRGYGGGGSIATEVQSALAEMGYYRGPVDGVIGNGTRNAIRRFQRDNGLAPTGRINARLLDELGVG